MHRRNVYVCTLVFIFLFAAGCGSTREFAAPYDNSEHVISYRSDELVLETAHQRQQLTVRAFAGCSTLPCRPQTVTLVFFDRLDEIDYREHHYLRIDAGAVRLEWPGPRYDQPSYRKDDSREEISIMLSLDEFRDIATAETVEGFLGPTSWTMPYDARAGFRSMVRQFQ